jgi:anti-sigma-K factor RskA
MNPHLEQEGRGEDIAAYVLGALDADGSARLEEHLQECGTCRAEYERLRVAADTLPLSVPQYQPPRELGERLMRTVRAEAKPTPRRRRGWLRPRLVLAPAAAAAAAAVIALAAAGVFSSGERTLHGHVVGVPAATAELRIQNGHAQLVLARMTPPPAGRIYEVWLQHAGQAPLPTAALFGVTRAGEALVAIPGDLSGVLNVLVTAEPLGGSAHPTRTPVIVVHL